MTNKLFFSVAGAFMIVSAIGFSGSIYADNSSKRASLDLRSNVDIRKEGENLLKWSYGPSILGTVTAVNGENITVKAGSASYTVDASAAKIRKGDDAQALSSISVGDTVFVQGAINGSSVVATMIVETKSGATVKPDIKDNLSGVVGTVTAVNGNTITIKAKNDVSYTINATNAKFWKNKNHSSTIAEVKVGDTLIVQGTINGTAVVATNIIDVKGPVNNDNMSVITGTVTAMSSTTITLKAANGTIYTANTADATFKDGKGKDDKKEDITVGDTVTIKGTLNGTTITASSVMEGKVKGYGFFYKFGNFFKQLFGNK